MIAKFPATEYIADREAVNFCEEFVLIGEGPKGKTKNKSQDKDRFNSLFRDE